MIVVTGGGIVQGRNKNVILFPTFKKDLREAGMAALKSGNHKVALQKINELLSYDTKDQEIIVGKLICLIELQQYEEAEDLCGELLANKDDKYYHYMHIYLTLLFQTNQFDMLIEQIDLELAKDNVPNFIVEQFQKLYQMGSQLRGDAISDQAIEYLAELSEAIHCKDYAKQWKLVENLRKMKIDPVEEVITYLEMKSVHPAVKTAMFKWLQDKKVTTDIHICKFGHHITIKPREVSEIRKHAMVKQVMLIIHALEQENPTLFILLEQLFYRYAYVRFPMMPPSNDAGKIAEALLDIGNEYLHMKVDEEKQIQPEIEYYIKEIKLCEHLYLSVIEE